MYFECDDEQYYVGKSGNMQERYYDHCRKLRYGTHINKKLQKSYLIYGNPTMEPLEEVLDLNEQSDREKYWIEKFDSYNNGMNSTIGGDDLGYGADTPSSLYTKEQYSEVLKELAITNKSLSKISEELGVSYAVVRKISNGSEHAWLMQEYPEYYSIVREKCGNRKGQVYAKDVYVEAMLMGMDINNTIEYISKVLELNISVVKNILYGNNHVHLSKEYPEQYAIMLSNKGLRLKGTSVNIPYPKVVSPEGRVYQVDNSRKFALEHNLIPSNFHKLLRGKLNTHKGWYIYTD